MIFNKDKFKKSKSGKTVRRQLPESHLDALDGKEVINDEIEYRADGEDFFLYPVMKDWCEEA